ncbi:MAG: hypothetical protein NZ700_00415 [Gemmataceae bacterium]|nr:hypothetical protein [Gemmataceae bacterium]MDW8265441.1 SpoIVB peptidase S55 domain-containing protein [Gemmataceae bacterium]
MTLSTLTLRWSLPIVGLFGILACSSTPAAPKRDSYWQVDDLRPGMKGVGRTVMKGTRIEPFHAEVLGILKNTSPGRDLVVCRLSGLDLERTGVIAGMSGSPIYIDGKLLGAVAYTWPFGKEPIAGVTPFCQMHDYVEAYERRDLVEQGEAPPRVGLAEPLRVGGRDYAAVAVSQGFDDPLPDDDGVLRLVPLRMPVTATGFTPHSLSLLRTRFRQAGLVPMEGGGVSAPIAEAEQNTPLQPGSPLAVALVTGDFDLSGIGTVTHIEGQRVYGWGHPFMGLGTCEFPLMTGYIHTVYPRQSVSFKLGSPLRTVGVINADVSTGIAGWLGRQPDLLPIRMKVVRESREDTDADSKTFQVRIVRQRSLLTSLVLTVLTNSVDMEGELPEDLTADLQARIEIAGHPPVVLKDTFSGSSYSGGRAPVALYNQVANVVHLLTFNSYQPVRIERIECSTRIRPGRLTADIEAIELDSDTYAPGETLRGTAYLRPYKGLRQRLPIALPLPSDLPEGSYTVTVCDDLTNVRQELRDNPNLSSPQNLDQVFEALKLQTSAKRTNLVVRLPLPAVGVALDGKSLPSLPPSMVQIFSNTRRTGAQTMSGALVARQNTPWVVQGSESVKFTVSKNKRTLAEP